MNSPLVFICFNEIAPVWYNCKAWCLVSCSPSNWFPLISSQDKEREGFHIIFMALSSEAGRVHTAIIFRCLHWPCPLRSCIWSWVRELIQKKTALFLLFLVFTWIQFLIWLADRKLAPSQGRHQEWWGEGWRKEAQTVLLAAQVCAGWVWPGSPSLVDSKIPATCRAEQK